MKALIEPFAVLVGQVRQQFEEAKGFRARLEIMCAAALVFIEIFAIVWVLTSYRFESVVPVYQQF